MSDAGSVPPKRPTVDAAGTVHAEAVEVRLSGFASPGVRAALLKRLSSPPSFPTGGTDEIRTWSDGIQKDILDRWLDLYPSAIEHADVGGVPCQMVQPSQGIAPENQHRVLIDLHGGGYFLGARYGGQIEAVPLAAAGGVKVVAVDYRMGPEHIFPAASEDVEAVYTALLADYAPAAIGICGTSAGGSLTAQSIARFIDRGLPLPGAIGIFASGFMESFWYGGDSGEVTPILNAQLPVRPGAFFPGPGGSYFAGADPASAQVIPGNHPDVLAAFPPTLFVTGTRDVSMSNALVSHAKLIEAGVETRLFVQESVGHGDYSVLVGTPEAALANRVMWQFFDRHLS
jgi:acetyl esterase/lipase